MKSNPMGDKKEPSSPLMSLLGLLRKERQFIDSERVRYICFDIRLLLFPNEIIILIDITLTILFWGQWVLFGVF